MLVAMLRIFPICFHPGLRPSKIQFLWTWSWQQKNGRRNTKKRKRKTRLWRMLSSIWRWSWTDGEMVRKKKRMTGVSVYFVFAMTVGILGHSGKRVWWRSLVLPCRCFLIPEVDIDSSCGQVTVCQVVLIYFQWDAPLATPGINLW